MFTHRRKNIGEAKVGLTKHHSGHAPPFASRSKFARLIPCGRALCALRCALMPPPDYWDDTLSSRYVHLLLRSPIACDILILVSGLWIRKVCPCCARDDTGLIEPTPVSRGNLSSPLSELYLRPGSSCYEALALRWADNRYLWVRVQFFLTRHWRGLIWEPPFGGSLFFLWFL